MNGARGDATDVLRAGVMDVEVVHNGSRGKVNEVGELGVRVFAASSARWMHGLAWSCTDFEPR